MEILQKTCYTGVQMTLHNISEEHAMDYTEEKLRRVNTVKGVIVDVETDMIRLQNGAITLREVVRHPGGVSKR